MEIKPFTKKVYLASPTMHGEELKYMKEAYDSNWMSTVGKNIDEVERIAAQKAEVKYAVGLSCCTAALHLCVKAAGEQETERGATCEAGCDRDGLGETGRMGEKIRTCEGVFLAERESERAGELYRAGRVVEQMGERAETDLFRKPEGQGFDERADRASGIGRHAVEMR